MGWVSSPPNFCACTETVANLANATLAQLEALELARVSPHRLDTVSETPISSKISKIPISTTEKLLENILDSQTNSKDQSVKSLVGLVHKIPVEIGLPRGYITEIFKISKKEFYKIEQHGEQKIDSSETSVPHQFSGTEISMTEKLRIDCSKTSVPQRFSGTDISMTEKH